MIQDIEAAAKKADINAFVLNDKDSIPMQLTNLSDKGLPTMLVSWNIKPRVDFDTNGFMKNPVAEITALLVKKADSNRKDDSWTIAEEMASLYTVFLKELYTILAPYAKNLVIPITNAGWEMVPRHGAGKHSGIVGTFTMILEITAC